MDAPSHQNPAIGKQRRGVTFAWGGERAGAGEGAGSGIVDLGNRAARGSGIESARNQDAAIVQEGRAVVAVGSDGRGGGDEAFRSRIEELRARRRISSSDNQNLAALQQRCCEALAVQEPHRAGGGESFNARSSLPALDVTAEVYLKVHAINEAMERATYTILELAENPVFSRGVLQNAAFQFRELLSRLNAALCTQLCDKELEQSGRIDRWISPGKYPGKD